MKRLSAALLAVSLFALTACGPTNHPHLSIRDYTTDVVYGSQNRDVLPPITGGALEPFFAPPAAVPNLEAPKPRTRTLEQCPSAAFSVDPAVKATPSIAAAPVESTYVFRQDGHTTFGGKETQPSQLAYRIVQRGPNGGTTFVFYVLDVQLGEYTDVSSFEVDQTTGNSAHDGLLWMGTARVMPDKSISYEFTPTQPLVLLPLPAQPTADGIAQTWTTAASDPDHDLNYEMSGTLNLVSGRVDACGTVLGGQSVHATGRVFGRDHNYTFDWTYVVATQFGGLVISEQLNKDGTDRGPAMAPNQGAQCLNGTGSYTSPSVVITSTTVANSQHAESPAPCPGDILHSQNEAVILSAPAVPTPKK
jgi:hypothetical protein